MISPLILQAQVVLPAKGGSMGLADTTKLENPFQAPMWLDEIRFRLPSTTADNYSVAPGFWSSLRVELKLGDISLTNGSVPVCLLGKVLNDSYEAHTISANASPGLFTWKLPKPLFVPAKALVRPTFYFEPTTGGSAFTVTIIYCCRPLPRGTPEPRSIQVPWVTYFKPPYVTTPGAVDRVDQSTPANLFNPFEQDLHVQRFVGRFLTLSAAFDDPGEEDDEQMELASVKTDLATGLVTTGTLVSAQDSFNNILIRDATPFAHVFSMLDRAWTVNCILPPKGFFLFNVDRLWSAYGPTTTATVGISMVGWREARYRP